MGIGNPQASNQVYWDANAGQYYTFNPYSQDSKTYLGDVLNTVNNATNKNKSIVDEMVARANASYTWHTMFQRLSIQLIQSRMVG